MADRGKGKRFWPWHCVIALLAAVFLTGLVSCDWGESSGLPLPLSVLYADGVFTPDLAEFQVWNGGGGVDAISAEGGHSGTKAIKVDASASWRGFDIITKSGIALESAGSVSLWAKNPGASPVTFEMGIGNTEAAKQTQTGNAVPADGLWHEFIMPVSQTSLIFHAFYFSVPSGRLLIDDISLLAR